mmetsp:Transcript_574/g.2080  ORF Transcript_574/g.2080 Transcript_574/m.2080 type:complete len:273 (-) Transcript_574:179-997(-)
MARRARLSGSMRAASRRRRWQQQVGCREQAPRREQQVGGGEQVGGREQFGGGGGDAEHAKADDDHGNRRRERGGVDAAVDGRAGKGRDRDARQRGKRLRQDGVVDEPRSGKAEDGVGLDGEEESEEHCSHRRRRPPLRRAEDDGGRPGLGDCAAEKPCQKPKRHGGEGAVERGRGVGVSRRPGLHKVKGAVGHEEEADAEPNRTRVERHERLHPERHADLRARIGAGRGRERNARRRRRGARPSLSTGPRRASAPTARPPRGSQRRAPRRRL